MLNFWILKNEQLIAAPEKYKTEHGEFPEKLDEFAGKYIQKFPKINAMNTMPYQWGTT